MAWPNAISALGSWSGFASASVLLLQTLLDRDHFTDAVTEEESDDPELWRQHYEVLAL